MRLRRIFTTIDTHTVGNPTRTIIGGLPYIPGKTIPEKMLHLKEHKDWIRQALMFEPRGNEVMSGVVLTEPCTPGADIGVIFIEVGGYLPMCGHDTIGVSTALIESGIIEPVEPVTHITLDTPAGLVRVQVQVKDNVAKDVSFANVPAFLFKAEHPVKVDGLGEVIVDVSYGGNYYAIVDADSINLDLSKENASKIIAVGKAINEAVNQQLEVYHPEKDFIDEVSHVLFSSKPHAPGSDTKNVVVIPPGSIDRSPCGTGTSAKLAALYAKGEIKQNQTLVFESIINTTFKGTVLEEAKVGEFDAIIPQITGRAYVMGINQWVIDPEDPIATGFFLK